jgi:hypothetical protein
MELLVGSFAAGSFIWVRYGPSHHPRRLYDQVKVTVMLGGNHRTQPFFRAAPLAQGPGSQPQHSFG